MHNIRNGFRANVRFSITMKVTLRRGRQQRAINVRIQDTVRLFIELLAKFQEPRLLCSVNVSNKRPNLRGNTDLKITSAVLPI